VLWGFLNWCRSVLSEGNVIDTATRLRAGWAGARISVGGDILISRHVHAGSRAHTIPHANRYLGWSCRNVTLSTVVLLAPRIRLSGIIPLHLCAFIGCAVQLNCTFTSSAVFLNRRARGPVPGLGISYTIINIFVNKYFIVEIFWGE
jgi:hypothetical protein